MFDETNCLSRRRLKSVWSHQLLCNQCLCLRMGLFMPLPPNTIFRENIHEQNREIEEKRAILKGGNKILTATIFLGDPHRGEGVPGQTSVSHSEEGKKQSAPPLPLPAPREGGGARSNGMVRSSGKAGKDRPTTGRRQPSMSTTCRGTIHCVEK